MRNSNWRERFQNFMAGRYGQDELSHFLLVVTLIVIIINFFTHSAFLGIIAGLLLVWVYVRMLSKDTARRAEENRRYLDVKDRVVSLFKRFGSRGRHDSSAQADFRIYRCPKCGQKIRIPKGHGMVEITCPKCRTRFRKRT